MELFLIDAIGPFFRNYKKNRINWSKIPFSHLLTDGPEATEQWQQIHQDMRDFAREVSSIGYRPFLKIICVLYVLCTCTFSVRF